MEAWATVAIVLVSNAIIGAVSVLTMRKQVKHSSEQFRVQLESEREADRRERRREVRSEPLLKLRSELARMGAKGEKVGYMVETRPFGTEGRMMEGEEPIEEFKEALNDWNMYMAGGEFQRVLFMQYDFVLVSKVDDIKLDYENARHNLRRYWRWFSDEDKREKYEKTLDVVARNRGKIAEVQLEINKLLEEL